jgi:hypothetical protein
VLGLGEVDVKDVERPQPHGGRLDLLLHGPLANIRYEVELQLGATDESTSSARLSIGIQSAPAGRSTSTWR